MSIFESLENLNVSEECFNEIMDMINEYIPLKKMNTLSNVHIKRKVATKDAPEGEQKERAQKKLERNIDLTNKYIEKHGSDLQKAVNRGHSNNNKEKKALLKAGYTIKEDPINGNKHNIVKY